MLKDKVSFTGLEIDVSDLMGREIKSPWPIYFHLVKVEISESNSYDISPIRKWLQKNTSKRYGLSCYYSSKNRRFQPDLLNPVAKDQKTYILVAFEDINEAMIFKLNDIETIIKENKKDDELF